VIKFFADEGRTWFEIHQDLKDHYGDNGISCSEVYRWIRDIIERGGEREKERKRERERERTSKQFQVQEGRQTKDFPR
jgi:hypothetical protein